MSARIIQRAALGALVGLAGLAGCATAPVEVTPNGTFITTGGNPLFTFRQFANDATRSPCAAECSAAWTPLYAGVNDHRGGDFTILRRQDGASQWAYRGVPLYFYAGPPRQLDLDPQMQLGLWAPLARGDRPASH